MGAFLMPAMNQTFLWVIAMAEPRLDSFFMVRSLSGWLLRNFHLSQASRATHTAFEPCIQVRMGQITRTLPGCFAAAVSPRLRASGSFIPSVPTDQEY